ncbi:uncharacterized protein [Canis lupus baileyi]|uniref:uncharacterized protein n=1 Tax=Canis lupus baileyi TaxID=143281 RepID=UPI003B96D692
MVNGVVPPSHRPRKRPRCGRRRGPRPPAPPAPPPLPPRPYPPAGLPQAGGSPCVRAPAPAAPRPAALAATHPQRGAPANPDTALTTLLQRRHPEQSPTRVSVAPPNRACPRMRLFPADPLRGVAGLSRRTASLRAAPPRPLRGSRCPECWGCTGSASDRPAMTSEGAPPAPRGPAASPTPYLTQQRRQLRFTAFPATAAKGAVKRRAVAAPVVVGDHRAALPRASARPQLRPRPPRSLTLSCLLPSHRSAR